jgi:hypothetical protein
MFVEMLAVKGVIIVAKFVAAHGMGTKVGCVLVKGVIANGLSATVGSVLALGFWVGGVAWGVDRVNQLRAVLKAMGEGRLGAAALDLASLAVSLHVPVEMLPDTVHQFLLAANVSQAHADAITNAIRGLEPSIGDQIAQLR